MGNGVGRRCEWRVRLEFSGADAVDLDNFRVDPGFAAHRVAGGEFQQDPFRAREIEGSAESVVDRTDGRYASIADAVAQGTQLVRVPHLQCDVLHGAGCDRRGEFGCVGDSPCPAQLGPAAAMRHFPLFLDRLHELDAEIFQEFPESCVPIRNGNLRGASFAERELTARRRS